MAFQSIQSWFEQVAKKHAARIAIEQGTREITYEALDRQANILANFIIDRGRSKGLKIVVFTDDTIELAVSIIATLRAGGIFIPLDTHLPPKRLKLMLNEVKPDWMVTRSAYLDPILKSHGINVPNIICLDAMENLDEHPDLSVHSDLFSAYNKDTIPAVPTASEDPCYIFFTSGSSGRPKAILGQLKSIDHFIRWEIDLLKLPEKTRVSQLVSPGFDAILRDLFVPLCTGGTVCAPASRDLFVNPQRLLSWIEEQQIQLIHCVPSLLRTLLPVSKDRTLSSLRYVLLSGEVLLPADILATRAAYGDRIRLFNLYGSTETTMTKFVYEVQPRDHDRRTIPIGKPITGARALLFDAQKRPCPAGTVGEIHIRTPYRTLGYYNQPDLTADVFVPNPLNPGDPNDLIYKTGDLGRVSEDGNFEFLGRIDQQVKIRGNRVELSEIEDLMRNHEAVNEVVVTVREDNQQISYLCAYMVTSKQIAEGAMRAYLSADLPLYMIPSVFVELSELPRSSNGKIDRRALPEPMINSTSDEHLPHESRTPTEEVLMSMWKEVLPLDQFGVHDDFFDIGGHSLLVMQLLARIELQFGFEISLKTFLKTPTIKGLAQTIEEYIVNQSDSIDDLVARINALDDAKIEKLLTGDDPFEFKN